MTTYKKYPRQFRVPKSSFFLFGPRGTGKTTLIQDLGLNATEISLLDEAKFQTYLAAPTLFYEELVNLKAGTWVLVDEIQRLPNLLNEVHRLIESRRLKFALTGSSARKLRRTGVNLLAGRAVSRNLYPLTAMEMGENFKLEKALAIGTLPIVVSSEDPQDTLQSYVQIYLKEEIQAEAIVRNLAGFARFLPVASLFHGQTINLSNIARDCEVQRPTVQGFFEILEDTLIIKKLEAYTAKISVREKKKKKCYFVDPGLVRTLQKRRGVVGAEEKGPLFEGLIFMMLQVQKEAYGEIDDIYYWSPAEAKLTEVDFLVQKGQDFFAIEVKATERIRPEDLKGLKAIAELKGLKRRILVYRGAVNRKTNEGIEIFTFSSFVELLRSKQL